MCAHVRACSQEPACCPGSTEGSGHFLCPFSCFGVISGVFLAPPPHSVSSYNNSATCYRRPANPHTLKLMLADERGFKG